MSRATDRALLVQSTLQRLADQRGDVTAEVLERYYRRMPDARASFEHHGLGDRAGLEARMVTESVFLLMKWTEDPRAAEIDQGTTIVHHNDVLEIGPRWYMGLIDAVIEIVVETLPAQARDERVIWRDLRQEIAGFIDGLRPEFMRPSRDPPVAS